MDSFGSDGKGDDDKGDGNVNATGLEDDNSQDTSSLTNVSSMNPGESVLLGDNSTDTFVERAGQSVNSIEFDDEDFLNVNDDISSSAFALQNHPNSTSRMEVSSNSTIVNSYSFNNNPSTSLINALDETIIDAMYDDTMINEIDNTVDHNEINVGVGVDVGVGLDLASSNTFLQAYPNSNSSKLENDTAKDYSRNYSSETNMEINSSHSTMDQENHNPIQSSHIDQREEYEYEEPGKISKVIEPLREHDVNMLNELMAKAHGKTGGLDGGIGAIGHTNDDHVIPQYEPIVGAGLVGQSGRTNQANLKKYWLSLKRHMLNEINAPTLLPFMPMSDFEMVQEWLRRRKDELEFASDAGIEKLVIVLGSMECERISHILRVYLRTRLEKIEEYCFSFSPDSVNLIMHPAEIEYWSKYCDIVANYLQDSFGSSLEMFNLPLFRTPGEILHPDEKAHVAVMLDGKYGDPEVKTVRLTDSYGDITSSDIFIMPFDRIKEQVLSNEYILI